MPFDEVVGLEAVATGGEAAAPATGVVAVTGSLGWLSFDEHPARRPTTDKVVRPTRNLWMTRLDTFGLSTHGSLDLKHRRAWITTAGSEVTGAEMPAAPE